MIFFPSSLSNAAQHARIAFAHSCYSLGIGVAVSAQAAPTPALGILAGLVVSATLTAGSSGR